MVTLVFYYYYYYSISIILIQLFGSITYTEISLEQFGSSKPEQHK